MRSQRTGVFGAAVVASAVAWAALAAGCAGGGGSSSDAASGSVNTGLDSILGEGDGGDGDPRPRADAGDLASGDIQRWLEDDAAILPSLAQGEIPDGPVIARGETPRTNLSPPVSVEQELGEIDDAPASKPDRPGRDNASSVSRDHDQNETTAEARVRLIREIATLLRREVRESDMPLREYAALAALELLEPGVVPDPTSIPTLTPREVEMLGAWRELFRRADAELTSASGDISALSIAVTELAQRMQEWETLEITTAELCSRVDGFGQYSPLPGMRMLAGRRNPAVVYVEVENFTHRAASGEDGRAGYVVELSQELSLYHDADGLLAWRQPTQDIRDFSRRKRRDFFIVQRVDLPETLSVGAYRLKITMRDKATGAIAERVLPIEIVADAALVRAR